MEQSGQNHEALQEIVGKLLPTLSANAAAVDASAEFPTEGIQALRDSGLFGLLIPESYGGLGGGLADLVGVAQRLASGCLSTALIWAMHCQQVDVLIRHATPRLRDELLPRIARGEVYLASVTTEPGKGGHLLSAVAALHDQDTMLTLRRDAPIVTGGAHADGLLVTMRESASAPTHRVTLVYVDASQAVIETRGEWDPLGMRGTHSVGMHVSATVPAHQVVGAPGEFRAVAVDSMIVVGHLGWSAAWIGAARKALADVVHLARAPRRPSSLDPGSDLAAYRLGRVRIDLEVVSAYLGQVLDEVMAHRVTGATMDATDTQIHLNTLKVVAAEHTFRAVDQLIQLTGLATGYLRNSVIPLERHFRDLRSASLNYSDDRLITATGKLTLADRAVRLAQGSLSATQLGDHCPQ